MGVFKMFNIITESKINKIRLSNNTVKKIKTEAHDCWICEFLSNNIKKDSVSNYILDSVLKTTEIAKHFREIIENEPNENKKEGVTEMKFPNRVAYKNIIEESKNVNKFLTCDKKHRINIPPPLTPKEEIDELLDKKSILKESKVKLKKLLNEWILEGATHMYWDSLLPVLIWITLGKNISYSVFEDYPTEEKINILKEIVDILKMEYTPGVLFDDIKSYAEEKANAYDKMHLFELLEKYKYYNYYPSIIKYINNLIKELDFNSENKAFNEAKKKKIFLDKKSNLKESKMKSKKLLNEWILEGVTHMYWGSLFHALIKITLGKTLSYSVFEGYPTEEKINILKEIVDVLKGEYTPETLLDALQFYAEEEIDAHIKVDLFQLLDAYEHYDYYSSIIKYINNLIKELSENAIGESEITSNKEFLNEWVEHNSVILYWSILLPAAIWLTSDVLKEVGHFITYSEFKEYPIEKKIKILEDVLYALKNEYTSETFVDALDYYAKKVKIKYPFIFKSLVKILRLFDDNKDIYPIFIERIENKIEQLYQKKEHLFEAKRKKTELWMQDAVPEENKGKLHKRLHIPEGEKIPVKRLKEEIAKLKKKKEARGKNAKYTKDELKFLHELQFALNAKKVNESKNKYKSGLIKFFM